MRISEWYRVHPEAVRPSEKVTVHIGPISFSLAPNGDLEVCAGSEVSPNLSVNACVGQELNPLTGRVETSPSLKVELDTDVATVSGGIDPFHPFDGNRSITVGAGYMPSTEAGRVGVTFDRSYEVNYELEREFREAIEDAQRRRDAFLRQGGQQRTETLAIPDNSVPVLTQEFEDTLRNAYNPSLEGLVNYYRQRGLTPSNINRVLERVGQQRAGNLPVNRAFGYSSAQSLPVQAPTNVNNVNASRLGSTGNGRQQRPAELVFDESAPRQGQRTPTSNNNERSRFYSSAPPDAQPPAVWDRSKPRYYTADGEFDAQGNRMDIYRLRYDTNGNRVTPRTNESSSWTSAIPTSGQSTSARQGADEAGLWDRSRPRYYTADGAFDAQGNRMSNSPPRYDANGSRMTPQANQSSSWTSAISGSNQPPAATPAPAGAARGASSSLQVAGPVVPAVPQRTFGTQSRSAALITH